MLIEFKVGNFLSFKDIVVFSMTASDHEVEASTVFTINKINLLKSAVLYGANASGKSNLLKAIAFMRRFVFESSKESQITEGINVKPFRLSTECEDKPSFFEITFICNQKKFRYGFEVDKNEVHSEWLFFVPKRTEAKLFVRERGNIKTGISFKEGKGLENRTRPNALFLSVVAQFNGEISSNLLKWFKSIIIISGLDDTSYIDFTLEQLENKKFLKRTVNLLKIADMGIENISINKIKINLEELPERIRSKFKNIAEKDENIESLTISTHHFKYNKDMNEIGFENFDLSKDESEGTQKFLFFTGPLIDTLDNSKILFVDELDARFHPVMTRFIIQLFRTKQTNPCNAQLIFATHDTKLLDSKLFRKDQIWFTEKNQYGASDLYSLIEYKDKNDSVLSFEDSYMLGEYGAIPFLSEFEMLMGVNDEEQQAVGNKKQAE